MALDIKQNEDVCDKKFIFRVHIVPQYNDRNKHHFFNQNSRTNNSVRVIFITRISPAMSDQDSYKSPTRRGLRSVKEIGVGCELHVRFKYYFVIITISGL